jgi:hypothetical protein
MTLVHDDEAFGALWQPAAAGLLVRREREVNAEPPSGGFPLGQKRCRHYTGGLSFLIERCRYRQGDIRLATPDRVGQ